MTPKRHMITNDEYYDSGSETPTLEVRQSPRNKKRMDYNSLHNFGFQPSLPSPSSLNATLRAAIFKSSPAAPSSNVTLRAAISKPPPAASSSNATFRAAISKPPQAKKPRTITTPALISSQAPQASPDGSCLEH